MKYILVNSENGIVKERDITPSVLANNGVQGFYHAIKHTAKDQPEVLFTLFKETEKGREFIFNIP